MSARRRTVLALVLAAALGAAPTAAAPAMAATGGPQLAAATGTADSCHEGTPRFLTAPETLANVSALQAPLVWNQSRGAGVTIAIVDSGINGADPRLAAALVPGVNLVDDGTSPDGRTDVYGHGTAIAGLISASPTDRSALVGLAPGAKIMPIRVYANTDQRSKEAGNSVSVSRMAQGIRVAADAGAKIINVSMSTEAASNTIDQAVAYATSKGSLVIASAGNVASDLDVTVTSSSEQLRYPAASPGALGVTATAWDSNVVTDSSVHGAHVAIAAPGQNVLTLGMNTGDCVYASDAPMSSYATAYVSAAAAMVASAHPTETPAQWSYRLEATALRGNSDARNNRSGWGSVQPLQAITFVPGPDTRGPENPFYPGGRSTEASKAQPVAIAPLSHQREADVHRLILVGVFAIVALALIGSTAAFIRRRRNSAEEAAAPKLP